MSLSERAIRRPVTTAMVFAAILIVGGVSLSRLAIDLLPEVDMPAISIFTTYQGVGPEEMETLITRPIEEAVSTVQGIQKIESFSSEGRSRVQLQFAWGVSLESAVNDVRAAVERIRAELPEEAAAPVVFKFDLSSFPVMYLALSGSISPWRLRLLADELIKYRLERVDGVAAVEVRGGLRREIHVELDADRLAAFGVTAAQVAAALRRDNVNLPAGDVLERGREVIVRTLGEYRTLRQMENVVVAVRQGKPLRVRDLARVRDAAEDPVNAVRIDGMHGIRLAVSKLSGANTVEVARRVRRAVEEINSDVRGVQLRVLSDTSKYIERSIGNVESGVLYGAGLALVVLLVFLRSLRATAIIGVAIPISIIGTFALMHLGGFTLNMISFGGLALGVGMLVDNAIVILENIERRRAAGDGPVEAAVRGSGEVSTAIIASTTTTLCIFIPVMFIGGFARIFFGQMAFVVTFALLCSLAVALTLIPMLASRGRREPDSGRGGLSSWLAATLTRGVEGMERGYGRLLAVVLRRRRLVYGGAVLLLAGSLLLTPLIGTELMPMGDQGQVRIMAELPVGTPLEQTERVGREVQQVIEQLVPERESVMAIAGPPGNHSQAGSNALMVRVELRPLAERRRSSEEVAAQLRPHLAKIPDLRARVRADEGLWIFRILRGGDERLSVDIRGHDMSIASRLARQVEAVLGEVRGVVDVDTDRKPGNREAQVLIDPDKAADVGLTVGEVADAVSTYVLGKAATYFRDRGDEFRVLVRLRQADRAHVGQLESLPLITPTGERVTLADVARIQRGEGPVFIRRVNQERIISVTSGFAGRDLGSIVRELRQRLTKVALPEGFTLTLGGEHEEQQRSFLELMAGLILAIVLVYMVMASLFESLLHPLVMLLAIPFAAIGVVATLLSTSTTLNINSFLGAIVLVGIVVNNAIVLVDYINLQRRQHGLGLEEAVITAGRRRLRPILMTTLTTSLALVPVALGLGEGSELQAPLARVVVGGLVVSSLITLLFIPALYTGLETIRERRALRRRQARS